MSPLHLHVGTFDRLCNHTLNSTFVRRGAISVTMYNFGSPRVGNKKFAEVYNQVTVNF